MPLGSHLGEQSAQFGPESIILAYNALDRQREVAERQRAERAASEWVFSGQSWDLPQDIHRILVGASGIARPTEQTSSQRQNRLLGSQRPTRPRKLDRSVQFMKVEDTGFAKWSKKIELETQGAIEQKSTLQKTEETKKEKGHGRYRTFQCPTVAQASLFASVINSP